MKLTLTDPKLLKDSISIISELVSEARFKVNSDSLELIAMDPANVAMVLFKIVSSAFSTFSVKGEEELAINLNNLKQVLRRLSSSETLTLETVDNKLKVTLKHKSTRTFHLPIIDLEEKEQRVPTLDFPLTVTTTSSNLVNAIEDADIVAESVSFMAEQNKFSVSAMGDLSQANMEIGADDDTKIVVDDVNTKVKSKYSVEYLKKMMLGSKISDNVIIKFNKDYPLRLEFMILNKVQLAFILAPRVDND